MGGIIRFLVGLLMPIILIAAGAGLSGLGLDQEWPIAIWAGLILIGVGVVWGLLLYFAAEAGSPFD
jgi:hypothetical protein